MNSTDPIKRRDFFKAAPRVFLSMALTSLFAREALKRQRLGANCLEVQACTVCAEFNNCSRPKADRARNVRGL